MVSCEFWGDLGFVRRLRGIVKWEIQMLATNGGSLQNRFSDYGTRTFLFHNGAKIFMYFYNGREFPLCDNASAAFLSFHIYSNFEFRMPLASLKYVVCA